MRRAVCIALAALGCTAAPADRVSWRESWELIGLTGRGQILDARVSVGHTGLLRGQGHLRLDRWMEQGAPITFHRLSAPGETGVYPDRERVRLGSDLLELTRRGWSLRVQSDDLSAVVHLEPTSTLRVPPVATLLPTGQWTVTATVPGGRTTGWLEAGERGGDLDGRGVLLYRGGDGLPAGPRTTLLVQGADVSIGLEEHGSARLAWVHLDGEAHDAAGATLLETREGWMASFPEADLTLTLKPRPVRGATDVRPGLLLPERLGVTALGQRGVRSVQAVQATLVRPGWTVVSPGVLIQVATPEERITLQRRGR